MTSIVLSKLNPDYIELIQLTDTHIFSDPDATFDGVDTAKTLQQVIAHIHKKGRLADAILATGDLVHDPEPSAYQRLVNILKTIQCPVFCIPGNHDDPVLMQQILNQDNICTPKSIHFENWVVLMLDSFLPNTHAGCLKDAELKYLDEQLNTHKNKFVLICLHHPPVSVNSPWMDRMGLQNPGELFAVIDRYPQVRAMLWGHIHQEFNSIRKDVKLMATPSTCVQFVPEADCYNKDNLSAGYRHLKLYPSGKIRTSIMRIGDL
jgi:3',5'-cyclic-AMP phosphodiesterase